MKQKSIINKPIAVHAVFSRTGGIVRCQVSPPLGYPKQPAALIPCVSIKQARAIVKLHGMSKEKLYRLLEDAYHSNEGCAERVLNVFNSLGL